MGYGGLVIKRVSTYDVRTRPPNSPPTAGPKNLERRPRAGTHHTEDFGRLQGRAEEESLQHIAPEIP
ncbi:hypothetical protein MPHO_26980 [Mycolicibacterium phocaicum]|nr:hypothetical protein MPHO_26980 [Mycolicibacterium phocaicum]